MLSNGTVHCWGRNNYGQIGNNSATGSFKLPQQVKDTVSTGTLSGATALVGSGYYHFCAIVNGGAQCWGYNGYGQLGNNTTTDSKYPVQVEGLTTGVTQIAVGYHLSCAVKSDNTMWCWGYNSYASLGDGTTTHRSIPVQVQGLPGGTISQITMTIGNVCALIGGAVYCLGFNGYKELGPDVAVTSAYPTLRLIPTLESGVTALYGGRMLCANQSGETKCWGASPYTQGQNEKHKLLPTAIGEFVTP